MDVMRGWEIFTRNEEKPGMGGRGGSLIMGDGKSWKSMKSLYVVGRGCWLCYFMKTPPNLYCWPPHPFFKFCPRTPTPTSLSPPTPAEWATPPHFCRGVWASNQIFKKGGGLTGPQLLEGGCWERRGDFFQGEGAQFLHKNKTWNI